VLGVIVFTAFFGEAWLEQRMRQAVKERIAASPNFKCGGNLIIEEKNERPPGTVNKG